ncbi:MAG TPA: putative metal-binding motif-containing protein [Solirubrobacter sp.]|nr:putative metal-binding motif-containing protein [Solirubrobacter sp.]
MIGLALLPAFAAPAAASASTISTDASHVYFDSRPGDRVSMGVNAGADGELGTAAFFVPLPNSGHVAPATADANCRTAGGARCKLVGEIDVLAGSQDDFLRIDSGGGQLVVFRAGGGDDRAFVSTLTNTRFDAFGEGGDDDLSGGGGIDNLDGGAGDDLLTPIGAFDSVTGGPGFDTVRIAGGGVTVTLDDLDNDGRAGETQNIHSDVEKVVGTAEADDLSGSAGADTLDGGDGGDTLNGLGGADTLIGNLGGDTIRARDGAADTISCGPGDDRVFADPADSVGADCETVLYADADQDGFDARRDCDDANPAIHPGATDVAGNGVDEDCSGADTPAPANPGTTPVPDTTPIPDATPIATPVSTAPARLQARVVYRWDLGARWSRVVQLSVRDAPKGARVTLRCSGRGCPFKTRSKKLPNGRGELAKAFKKRRLKQGAVVDVMIGAPRTIAKVVRFTVVGKHKLPRQQQLCRPPGVRAPQVCR